MIYIVDFGSQVTQLIARRVREANVYCEIVSNKNLLNKIKSRKPAGIIFSGGAMRINDMSDEIKKHINFASNCFNHNKKILAICRGLQVCSTAAGGKVAPGKKGAKFTPGPPAEPTAEPGD